MSPVELRDMYSTEQFQYRKDGFDLQFVQYDERERRIHPPQTPLLWSIGEAAFAPQEQESRVEFGPTGNFVQVLDDRYDSENEIRRERFMRLIATENGPSFDPQVMALPTQFAE